MSTYTSDGTQADVQVKITAAKNAGDAAAVVTLPIGTFQWTTTGNGVAIDAIDGITIRGAGIDQTIIDDRTQGNSAQAVFNFQNYHLASKSFRITGLTIAHHATLCSSAGILTSSPGFGLVDHIKITEVRTRGIYFSGAQGNYESPVGLVTQCELYGRATDGVSQLITVFGNDFELPPVVASTTKSSWYNPADMGGSNMVFVENSVLVNYAPQDATIETYSGGRCVVRYCPNLTNFIIGHHGNDSSTRSAHTSEIYNNVIYQTLGNGIDTTVNIRGGTSYFHDNTITETGVGTTSPMTLQLYRGAGYTLTNGNPFVTTLVTAAGNFVTGRKYSISVVGTTDFTAIGAASNALGTVFTATGPGSGTGTASCYDYVGRYDYVPVVSRYERAHVPVGGNTNAPIVVVGRTYRITLVGTTNWVAIGAASNTLGTTFTCTATGSGSGLCTSTSIYFALVSGEWRLYGFGLHQLTHPGVTVHGYDQVESYPGGSYVASGSGDIVVASGGSVRTYNNNLLNGGQPTDGNTPVATGSGTHTGSAGDTVLTDSTKSWSTNVHLGYGTAAHDDELWTRHIWNMTSGASGFITANTATTVTAVLSGGTRQTWSAGDVYIITNGYPGLDQAGWAGPTRFYDKTGTLTNTLSAVAYSTQTLTPCYVWNNTWNGSPDTRSVAISWNGTIDSVVAPRISEFIQEGREYRNNAGAPDGHTPYTYPHPLTPTTTALVTNKVKRNIIVALVSNL